jgi:hypothetical protein
MTLVQSTTLNILEYGRASSKGHFNNENEKQPDTTTWATKISHQKVWKFPFLGIEIRDGGPSHPGMNYKHIKVGIGV